LELFDKEASCMVSLSYLKKKSLNEAFLLELKLLELKLLELESNDSNSL
jgi:hypothetical protein